MMDEGMREYVAVLGDAESAIRALETFAGQVEVGERPGDLGALLVGAAISRSLLALTYGLRLELKSLARATYSAGGV